MLMPIEKLIAGLDLESHPEGGWYRETYRAATAIGPEALGPQFTGSRSVATAIYFLLARGEFSALHRISSDELWHFYSGTSLTVQMIAPDGDYQQLRLGPDLARGETFQALVPAGSWFGAEVSGPGPYSLVGCTVAPGFAFADFEMGDRAELLGIYPEHEQLIKRLTRK